MKPDARPPRVDPTAFRDRVLGFWSSHPHWQGRRARRMLALSLLPLILAFAFGLLSLVEYESWIERLRGAGLVLIWIAGAVAFAMSFFLTLALQGRWAGMQRRSGKLAGPGAEDRRIEWWAFGIALVIGILGPVLGLTAPAGLSTVGRYALHLCAFLPLVGVLIAIRSADPGSPQGTRRGRPVWVAVFVLLSALFTLTLAHDTSLAWQQGRIREGVAKLIPWYADLERPFLGLFVLGPLLLVLSSLLGIWRATDPEARSERKGGWLARAWRWITRLFRGDDAVPGAEKSEPEEPAWLADFLEHLPQGCRLSGRPSRVSSRSLSPICEEPAAVGLRVFFEGQVPTGDQLDAFRRFVDAYAEIVKGAWTEADRGAAVEPSADLLIDGDPGSGRTTTVIACATYAALARGHRVLVAVPAEDHAQRMVARVDATLRHAGFHHYLSCKRIDAHAVSDWIAPETTGRKPLPHILVGTVEDIERSLYGHEEARASLRERLRRLILLCDVLLVDGITEFDEAQRSHLAFLLDKQRLLLDGEHVLMQTLVTCARLAPIGRETLGRRLFTQRLLKLHENVLGLRPRPAGSAWQVELEAEDVAGVTEALLLWCLRRGLELVLYRKGADRRACQEEAEDLRAKAGGAGTIEVISDLAQPLGAEHGRVDAVFHQVAVHEETCIAVRLHLGSDDTVIVGVRPLGEPLPRVPEGVVPLVASRKTEPLLVAHLRSVIRFLREHSPVSANAWAQFGLGSAHDRFPVGEGRSAPAWMLHYDDAQVATRWHGDAAIWPYFTLEGRDPDWAHLDTYSLPDEPRRLFWLPGGISLYMGRSAEWEGDLARAYDPVQRRGVWYTRDGADLKRHLDLAHVRALRLTYGTETFCAQPDIARERDGSYLLQAKPWRGDGRDAYLPLLGLRWSIGTALALPEGGGPEHGLQWFELVEPQDQPAICDARITQLLTEYGLETTMPTVDYVYPARTSAVLFMPNEVDPNQLREVLGAAFVGTWGTGGEGSFWPELTAALGYALDVLLPGTSYFSRPLCFRLTGLREDVGAAVMLILEPWTAGRTVLPVLGGILESLEDRQQLLETALWFLDRLGESDTPQHFARRFLQGGYEGEVERGSLDEASQLLREVRGRAEALVSR